MDGAKVTPLQLILIFYFLTFTSFSNAGLFDKSVSSALLSMSKEFNKNLPVKVGKDIFLETTVAIKDVLISKYRITDDSTFKDPRFDINKYRYHFINSQGEALCKDEGTLALIKKGAAFNYIFINQYGEKLFDFTLNERECLNYLSGGK